MKIAVDTNVLVRVAVRDDARQARLAFRLLKQSPTVIVGLACLCEFVWVLEMNRPAVEAGLAMLDAGGDFADGIIAAECRWMGGETFVSFDRRAVSKLTAQHYSARLLDAAHSDSHRRTH
jgi:predicted nucleic-acid-binding protein